jgi:hypothetical protein
MDTRNVLISFAFFPSGTNEGADYRLRLSQSSASASSNRKKKLRK